MVSLQGTVNYMANIPHDMRPLYTVDGRPVYNPGFDEETIKMQNLHRFNTQNWDASAVIDATLAQYKIREDSRLRRAEEKAPAYKLNLWLNWFLGIKHEQPDPSLSKPYKKSLMCWFIGHKYSGYGSRSCDRCHLKVPQGEA